MKRSTRWHLVVVALLALACGGDATGPTPGTLVVSLATPGARTEGAVLFTLTGPAAVTSAAPVAGLRIFYESFGATATRFIVTGPITAGPMLTVGVADVGQASRYAAPIQQVAGTDYVLRPLAGYRLSVNR